MDIKLLLILFNFVPSPKVFYIPPANLHCWVGQSNSPLPRTSSVLVAFQLLCGDTVNKTTYKRTHLEVHGVSELESMTL